MSRTSRPIALLPRVRPHLAAGSTSRSTPASSRTARTMPRWTEVVPSSSQTVTVRPDSLAVSIFSSMWSIARPPSGTAATAVTAPRTTVSSSRAANRLPGGAGRASAWRRAAAWIGSSVGGFHGTTGGSSPPASRCTCCAHDDCPPPAPPVSGPEADRGGAAGVAAGAGAAGGGAGVLAAGAAGRGRGAGVGGRAGGAAARRGADGGGAAAGAGAAGAPPAAGATGRNVMVPSSWRALPAGAAGPAPPAAAGAPAAGSAAAPSASGADASGALGSEPQEILRSCPPPKPDWRERSAPHAEAGSGRLPCWDSAGDGEGAGEGDGTGAAGDAGAGAAAGGSSTGSSSKKCGPVSSTAGCAGAVPGGGARRSPAAGAGRLVPGTQEAPFQYRTYPGMDGSG